MSILPVHRRHLNTHIANHCWHLAISNSSTSLPYYIQQVDGYKPTEEKKITELSLLLLVPIVIPDA